jgi:Rrf2 family protein
MAHLFGKPTEYAVRALIFIEARKDPAPVSVRVIAQADGLSSHHLSKVMKTLTRYRLVHPVRGPGGGYVLAKNAGVITLWDIMAAMGALGGLEECAIGWKQCRDENPCPLHGQWTLLRERITSYLQETTLTNLVEAMAKKGRELGTITLNIPTQPASRRAG